MTSYQVTTEPAVEPASRTELKQWLRLDTAAAELTTSVSIAAATRTTGTITGTGVALTGYPVVVAASVGSMSGTGTITYTLYESADDSTYTALAGGPHISLAADGTTTYEYTGTAAYLQARVTIPAAVTAVTAAYVSCRASLDSEEAILDLLLAMGRGEVEGTTKRALITQTITMHLDDWPGSSICLPAPPLQAVSSISYVDTNGTTQTLSSSYYTVDTAAEPGYVNLAYGYSWPTVRDVPNAITIVYTAGYGDAASDVPAALRTATLLVAAWHYDNRGDAARQPSSGPNAGLRASKALALPYLVRWIGA